ncbi:MAG: hypothetical protein ACT4P7_06400, partial [Gemmatimonadaceae bacterium]
MHLSSRTRAACALTFVLVAGACRGESEASPAGGEKGAARTKTGGPTSGKAGPSGMMRQPTVLGPTDVMEVKTGQIEAAITISGNLRAIEEIAVRSRMEGDLIRVAVREGDRVSRGQLLAQFESVVQEGDRASAAADVEAAKSDVTNARWNADQSAELFKAGAIPER